MLVNILFILIGFTALFIGGNALVDGARELALKAGVPAFIVSATVVAFGTSAPELIVALQAINEGASGLVLGNIVGSNIANIFLVLGVPALIYGIFSEKSNIRYDYLYMIIASLLFAVFCYDLTITFQEGVISLILLFAIISWSVFSATSHEKNEDDISEVSLKWTIALLTFGMVALPVGAHFLVQGSVFIAKSFGIPETVIGVTIIAVGTSLPELATTVMAARQRAADIAIGNVLGSNLFNLLAIGGIASLLQPIPVAPFFLNLDIWVMVCASLTLIPYVIFYKHLTRAWGGIFLIAYFIYILSIL